MPEISLSIHKKSIAVIALGIAFFSVPLFVQARHRPECVNTQPVYHVTNLEDHGAGSLRCGLTEANRTIVFDVGGVIRLEKPITIGKSFIVLDGATAPIPVTLKDFGLRIRGIDAHHITIRHLRIRDAGVAAQSQPEGDGIQVAGGTHDIVLDHISVSNSWDGNIDITQAGTKNVVVEHSILARPSGSAGDDGKNMLLGNLATRISLSHNLFFEGKERNPQFTFDDNGQDANGFSEDTGTSLDMRNNLIWNWGNYGTRIRYGAHANVMSNLYGGNRADAQDALRVCDGGGNESLCENPALNKARAYVAGNLVLGSAVNPNSESTKPSPFEALLSDAAERPCDGAREVVASAGARPLDSIDASFIARIDLSSCTYAKTRVRAAVSIPQFIPRKTWQRVHFASELKDVTGEWSPITSRFTAREAKTVSVKAWVTIRDAIAGKTYRLAIVKNGVLIHREAMAAPISGTYTLQFSNLVDVPVAPRDTLEIQLKHNNPIPLAVVPQGNLSSVLIHERTLTAEADEVVSQPVRTKGFLANTSALLREFWNIFLRL